MRQLVLFWLFWMTGVGLAAAEDLRPAETPPGDFPGVQYIDSNGCVFARSGRNWVPKLDEDGIQLCGFPPSRSAWDSARAITAAPPSLADIERDLTISVIEAEGAGINLSAPTTPVTDPADSSSMPPGAVKSAGTAPTPAAAAPPASSGVPEPGIGAEIVRGLRAEPVLAAQITATAEPNSRLCELLGLKPARGGGLPLGADPTRGYCGGQKSSVLPGSQAIAADAAGAERAAAVAKGRAEGGASVGASSTARSPESASAKASLTSEQPMTAAAGATAKAGAAAQASHAAQVKDGQAMASKGAAVESEQVPAGARYVQIGHFNADGVTAAIAALRAMGYPIARQVRMDASGQRIVVAGPFDTRERLIAALDRLRKGGYPQAFAR